MIAHTVKSDEQHLAAPAVLRDGIAVFDFAAVQKIVNVVIGINLSYGSISGIFPKKLPADFMKKIRVAFIAYSAALDTGNGGGYIAADKRD